MRQNAFALALLIGSLGPLAATCLAAPAPAVPQVIVPASTPLFLAIQAYGPTVAKPVAESLAPMPDQDAAAPVVDVSGQTKVEPTLYVDKSHYEGDGYAAGSSDHERSMEPAAGLLVNVPLN